MLRVHHITYDNLWPYQSWSEWPASSPSSSSVSWSRASAASRPWLKSWWH